MAQTIISAKVIFLGGDNTGVTHCIFYGDQVIAVIQHQDTSYAVQDAFLNTAQLLPGADRDIRQLRLVAFAQHFQPRLRVAHYRHLTADTVMLVTLNRLSVSASRLRL